MHFLSSVSFTDGTIGPDGLVLSPLVLCIVRETFRYRFMFFCIHATHTEASVWKANLVSAHGYAGATGGPKRSANLGRVWSETDDDSDRS